MMTMKITRRNFLKGAIAGIGAATLTVSILPKGKNINPLNVSGESDGTSEKIKVVTPDEEQRHWGFVIDLSKCNGCVDQDPPPSDPENRAYDPTGEKPLCTYACRINHYYIRAGKPQYWIRVYKIQENPFIPAHFFPKPCQNCEDPPCRRVCPTGATFKRKDGTVLINQKICIGCRMCMAACPYEARFFWFSKPEYHPKDKIEVDKYEYVPERQTPFMRGTVVKCDYCLHMAYKGQSPSCVSACPRRVLYFGDLNEDAVSNGDEVILFRQTLEEKGGYRFKEDEKTGSSVYYLPPAGQPHDANKLATQLNVEVKNPKDFGDLFEVNIHARDDRGRPISAARIVVKRMTTFGQVKVSEGLTDTSGIFTTTIRSSYPNNLRIRAELVETEQYKQSVVNKRC
ncbi:MAG: 4Fe-4S dicluster domain-containing protein [Candidatus Odinarchaeota archaeon]